MAQAIRKKLDGNLPEFLEDVKGLTLWPALEKWGLERSYLSVKKIIWEETHDENFGVSSNSNSYVMGGIKGLLREFVAAFADYSIRTERENESLRQQLNAYQGNGAKSELEFAGAIAGLTEALKKA